MPTLHQACPKLLIQMSGAPGSGKSTLGRLLRPAINGVVVDHDVLRPSLLSDTVAFDQAARQAYLLQWALAEDFIKQGLNVIIDSTCNYQEVLAQGISLASKYSCTYWYVECKVPDIDLLDQRLRARRDPMMSQRTAVDCPPVAAQDSRAGEDAYALFTKWIENPCRPAENAIILNSIASPEDLTDLVLRQIRS